MSSSPVIKRFKSSKPTIDSRKSSLNEILKNQYKVKEEKLVQALIALAEGEPPEDQ